MSGKRNKAAGNVGGGRRLRNGLWLAGFLGVAAVLGVLACNVGNSTDPDSRDAARTEEELLCWQFADYKDAHDRRADDLLGAAPVVPAEPVTPEEAERLVAELLLHKSDVRVLEVHR